MSNHVFTTSVSVTQWLKWSRTIILLRELCMLTKAVKNNLFLNDDSNDAHLSALLVTGKHFHTSDHCLSNHANVCFGPSRNQGTEGD